MFYSQSSVAELCNSSKSIPPVLISFEERLFIEELITSFSAFGKDGTRAHALEESRNSGALSAIEAL
jgi:hypothetical protein